MKTIDLTVLYRLTIQQVYTDKIQPIKMTKAEIIKKRYPFYDEDLSIKDVELNGEQVQDLMQEYARDLSIEFVTWKDRNFFRVDQNSYIPLYADIHKSKRVTYVELFDLFLIATPTATIYKVCPSCGSDNIFKDGTWNCKNCTYEWGGK